MNTFATGSLPVHFSVAKLFNFRWQYTDYPYQILKNITVVSFLEITAQTYYPTRQARYSRQS